MRVLLLPQVYPPEAHPTAIMVHQLARKLVESGAAVTVACGYPHHPYGAVLGGYEKHAWLRESKDGVPVVRAWHYTTTRRSIPARALVMISQAMATTIAGQLTEPPDVVLNVGPPVVGPLAAALLAKRFGAKLVTIVYDIYPDVAVTTGKIKSRAVIRASALAADLGYRSSDSVVVLSEGFRDALVDKGVPRQKIEVIPVWLEADEIRPLPRETRLRDELGLDPSRFVVLYAGTIGLVSGAMVVPEAAALVKNPRVTFVFVGEGEALPDLKRLVSAKRLENVHFLPLQPRERLAEVQSSADVGLVTLAPGCGRTSVPSKVIGYLAAGRPVVGSVDLISDTAKCIQAASGVVVPPGDPHALARAIDELSEARLEASGAAARELFLREYTAEAAVGKYIQLFQRLANPPASAKARLEC